MASDVARRSAALGWRAIEESLEERGYARTERVLTPAECDSLAALYRDESRFRSRVDMARHRFGLGEYKYFARPLPPLVAELRASAFPHLAAIANRWAERLGQDARVGHVVAGDDGAEPHARGPADPPGWDRSGVVNGSSPQVDGDGRPPPGRRRRAETHGGRAGARSA